MPALDSALRLRVLEACGLTDGSTQNEQLDRLTDLATSAIGAPVALVSLVTPNSQVFAGMTGLNGWAGEQRQTPLSHSFCQFVVIDDRTLIIEDARLDDRLAHNLAIPELDVIAYLGVPVRASNGAVLGSFCVIDSQPRTWTPDDLRFVETLASAASLEIERQTRMDGLMTDLRKRLAPHVLPSVAWAHIHGTYEALDNEQLGGDFYDASVGEDGRVSIALGDIVGHGADATLAMGQLRAASGVQMYGGIPLEQVFANLDGYVEAHFPGIRNAALTLVSVWPDGRIEHMRGGAWPPMIVSGDGVVRSIEAGAGWPVASFVETRVAPATDHLEVNDTLIVFSDGLPESHDSDPGRAMEALISALSTLGTASLPDIHEALADSLAPRHDRRDDLAIISLRRTR